MRAYGLDGLRLRIRNHIVWSEKLCERLRDTPGFEIVTDPILSLFTFRYVREGAEDLDKLNLQLVNALNDDGRIYLTQSEHEGMLVIRFVTGQFDMEEHDVDIAFDVITEMAAELT